MPFLHLWFFTLSIRFKNCCSFPSPQAVFSAAAQLTASVLTSEETKRLSPDEDEFHSCQSGSNSTTHSHSGSSESVNVDDTKNHASFGITPTNAETGSTKTTLTSVTDSGLVPVVDHNHPLSEVVVSSTTTDHMTSTGEDNVSFLSRQPQQTASWGLCPRCQYFLVSFPWKRTVSSLCQDFVKWVIKECEVNNI